MGLSEQVEWAMSQAQLAWNARLRDAPTAISFVELAIRLGYRPRGDSGRPDQLIAEMDLYLAPQNAPVRDAFRYAAEQLATGSAPHKEVGMYLAEAGSILNRRTIDWGNTSQEYWHGLVNEWKYNVRER